MRIRRLTIFVALFITMSATLAEASAVDTQSRKLVVIGASYAASWPIDQIAGHEVINVGLDGNQSFEMVERFERDVLARDPDKVLIWGFINDIFRSNHNELDETIERIRSGFREMVETAESNEIEVLLATEVSIREPAGFVNWVSGVVGRALGKTSYQETINSKVHEVNTWLKDYGKSKDIVVLDFESLLALPDGRRQSQFAIDDGSHLTSAAYDAITTHTRRVLGDDNSVNEVN